MTLKRSRTGDDDELVQRPPQTQARRARKSEPESALQLRFQSLAIHQRNDDVNNQPKIGEFLQCCYYCKKRISLAAEVYMYKDFCAFCSVECRDIQISFDTNKN